MLRARGHAVEVHHHLPRRGLAEQRDFLLAQVRARYALFLDDDLILEPEAISRMLAAIAEESCGFVGCAVTGLSFVDDVRLHEQEIEFWDGPVRPEVVRPQWPQWERYRLHNAANVYHLHQRLRICADPPRKYKVAWVGGCVLYDAQALRDSGGFGFWRELPPEHCGEDVLAQLRVMGVLRRLRPPAHGVYHQELPTTVVERRVDAPTVLPVEG